MIMTKVKILVPLFLACVLSSGSYGQDEAHDAKAVEIMAEAVKFYQGIDSLQVDTEFNIKISSDNPAFGGEDVNQTLTQKLSIKKPGQFSLVTEGDAAGMGGADMYLDKGVGTVLIPDQGAIQVKEIDGLIAFFENEALGYQKEAEMSPFLDQNIAVSTLKSLMVRKEGEPWDKNVTALKYKGEEEIKGEKTHRVQITAEQTVMGQTQSMDMDLWLKVGDEPRLIKVVPDMEAMMKAMAGENPMMAEMSFEISGGYANWNIGGEIADDVFTADVGDTKMYDDFMGLMTALMGGGGPGGAGENPADALVGQPAEDFELELLGGESFKLSDHKGKDVVILDFWATWCGPCVRALPELMAAADDFKDKNVKLIAVNQREKTSRIEKFLTKEGWSLTVALDTEGAVGDIFKVQGIPQTVIIGKDGLVKKVHVGFAPGLKDQITAELEEILAE
jgi:thiol-disulfide isomerase/thioredoxin